MRAERPEGQKCAGLGETRRPAWQLVSCSLKNPKIGGRGPTVTGERGGGCLRMRTSAVLVLVQGISVATRLVDTAVAVSGSNGGYCTYEKLRAAGDSSKSGITPSY